MTHLPYTVLVAEDEELLLENTIKKIEKAELGFKVVCKAQTGTQALSLATSFLPNLIVTDIKMPLMTGIELLEQVHHLLPQTQFIITSGFSDFEYAKQAIKLQVSEYLLKPINPNELYNALLEVKTKLDLENNNYHSIFNSSTTRHTPEHIAHLLKEYIMHNYTLDINLNLIAEAMNYSSSYLTKLFIQQYQISPIKYIINLRIQKAKHLLMHNPNLSIKQIGEIVGYPDQGYFSRIFKKHVDSSPYNYREMTISQKESI